MPTNVAGPIPAAKAIFDVAVGIDHVGMVNSGAFYAPGLLSVFQINFVVGNTVAFGERNLNVVAQACRAKRYDSRSAHEQASVDQRLVGHRLYVFADI